MLRGRNFLSSFYALCAIRVRSRIDEKTQCALTWWWALTERPPAAAAALFRSELLLDNNPLVLNFDSHGNDDGGGEGEGDGLLDRSSPT